MLRSPRRQPNTPSKGKGKSEDKGNDKAEENQANEALDAMEIEQPEPDQKQDPSMHEEMEITADEKSKLAPESQRTPVKLYGRGGFRRPRAANPPSKSSAGLTTITSASPPSSQREEVVNNVTKKGKEAEADDAMEGLMSRMSALQFVPRSVRVAGSRGVAKGRGQA